MKILVFGALNIDYTYSVDHFVQKGETISSSELSVFSGGKGLNQAIAFSKAGANVYQAGCIGTDGKVLLSTLEEAGVNTSYVHVSQEYRSGNAIIQNDKEGDNCIILYGGSNQEIKKEYVDEVLSHFAEGDYIVLQNEINEMSYIIERAKEVGMVVVLNPSPMDEKVFTFPLACVDYLILNEVEACQLLDIPSEDYNEGEILVSLHEKFPNMKIVLTLGSLGSRYLDNEETVNQSCYKVKAVDTTAAGDTYTGYFIASVIQNKSVKEAMDIASKASAIAVGRKGASSSIPTYNEVIRS
ncbi:ribokinase [Aequitasia blattaphilus]|uniref:Ribokinase n=1 Tax=Aequitasia blattaphilus TaxID=2949332 RepID=A0ABT1E7Y4_9FIRM|nr:ribokinase [Aequitasia blattaphilus]MCP1101938.1 ribokinase [Aequitasia blattaphilus]MCR8614578.1 ribokinase [Aequitasia blattaphilus]